MTLQRTTVVGKDNMVRQSELCDTANISLTACGDLIPHFFAHVPFVQTTTKRAPLEGPPS